MSDIFLQAEVFKNPECRLSYCLRKELPDHFVQGSYGVKMNISFILIDSAYNVRRELRC